MDRRKAYRVSSLMAVACFILAIVLTPPSMADYANETVTDTNDPVFWLDRGGLYATYGSYSAAIKAYNKALELDDANSLAYFNRGLAYAEIGDLNQALVDINKAISLNAYQNNFYYARGRVLLMSGDKEQAWKDFKKAAQMGDLDAIRYLRENQ